MTRIHGRPTEEIEPHQRQHWQTRMIEGDHTVHVHLLGIGGTGLYPIATVLHQQGFGVSGSDVQANERTAVLMAQGVQVFTQQDAQTLTQRLDRRPDVVLISSAVGADNPELRAAIEMDLPIVKRREFLGPFLARRQVLAVAGTHGKSTTTGMIVQTLHECGVDAGYIIGSSLPGYGSAHAGSSPYFVIEADEYDHMFLGLMPSIAVITNVEWDHPDCYPTPERFEQAFRAFVAGVAPDGVVISCADDAGAEAIRASHASQSEWQTYGFSPQAMLRAVDAAPGPAGGYRAKVHWQGEALGILDLQVPGSHNLSNALAALAVARRCHLPMTRACQALAHYNGIARRFECKGEAADVTVIDDYAHHPTEVRATLAAVRARYGERRVWAIFQPHTFSRTRQMLSEMAASFADADRVIVADIYAARERNDDSVSAADLVAASDHPQIEHIGGLEAIAHALADRVQTGDVVVTMGAGTSYRIGEMLLAKLRDEGRRCKDQRRRTKDGG